MATSILETPPMQQAIAGVTPAEVQEATVMTVWPSVAMFGAGRLLGRLYAIRWPDIYIFRLGHLMALAMIPVSLVLFFLRILPGVGLRYRLTNRRVIVERGIMGTVERGIMGTEEKSVDLDRFDAIDIDVLPGQAWYDAGDLVFRLGNTETFRLEGVSRPEAFRQTILKARMVYVGLKKSRRT